MGAQNERKTSDVIVVSHVQAEFSLNKREANFHFFRCDSPGSADRESVTILNIFRPSEASELPTTAEFQWETL